ncbi:MAG TPA: ribose-5-phosphate isomerase RpiA [Blastocatellia bacterium]|nr:ribose-5-phosphate isomerase RpiA [Blastocatellia bacterium]
MPKQHEVISLMHMSDDLKRSAAEKAVADFIKDGQVIGLGTGSTAEYAIKEIGRLVAAGLKVRAIPTSLAAERLAIQHAIPLVDFNDFPRIDVTIDGADQIDPAFNMIKGGGGALTREKLVACATDLEVIVVDERKLVPVLGPGFPLPVEVVPFAWRRTATLLEDLGSKPALRVRDGKPVLTDNGNYVLDCDFGPIADCAGLERRIKLVPGVLECGLFVGLADVMIVGRGAGAEIKRR